MKDRRLPFVLTRPEQGWSSLLLLLGMYVLLGVSIADSRPMAIEGHGALSTSLPMVMVASGLIGYLLARSALGVVRAHFVGAAVAALMLLTVTGAALLGQSPLPTGLDGLGERVSAVWMRLDADIGALISEQITTSTVTVFLVLAALCWTTAQFGAFSVFRYDRGGPAAMAVGTILFLNVGLGSLQAQSELLPVVPVLALFAGLALLLLMRLQLVQQRYAWARRHISDTRDVDRLFMRTGVAFVVVAVVSASSLTAWATVEAQDVSVDGLEEPLADIAEHLENLLAIIGAPPGEGVPPSLDDSTRLSTQWDPGEGIAFTAEVVAGSLYDNYWWGKADDLYDYENDRWVTTSAEGQEFVPAGGSLWPGPDALTGGPQRISVVVFADGGAARTNLYRPPDVAQVRSHGVEARRTADGGISDIGYVEALDQGAQVGFTSSVRDYSPGSRDLTGNMLRATAGGAYPPAVLEYYLEGAADPNVIGPHTKARIAKVREQAGGDTPYDLAVATQAELRSMTYDTDVSDLCAGRAFTECLLAEERGFCQQYATTMVMMMRKMGVPARFVTGYLQGDLQDDGRWVVPQEALHNWAEVYFPEVGWVRFDPTPGLDRLGQVPTALEDGAPIADGLTPSPAPDETELLEETEPPFEPIEPEEPVVDGDGPGGSGNDDTGVFVSLAAILGLLAAVVSVALLFRLRRLPEGDDSLAYLGIVSLATRLGYGPHPSQTEYEYASTLSETIPNVRDDLYVVTEAQVQTSYGGRRLDDARRGPLRSAYARIRTALLRLSLRWRR